MAQLHPALVFQDHHEITAKFPANILADHTWQVTARRKTIQHPCPHLPSVHLLPFDRDRLVHCIVHNGLAREHLLFSTPFSVFYILKRLASGTFNLTNLMSHR